MTATLLIETHGEVALLRLNRPQRRNAINGALLDELTAALARLEADPAVRALVVTGNEQAFSAGQDLKEPEPVDFVERINAAFNRLEDFPKPTVAAIGGWCIAGGLELALTCDARIAGDGAKIGDWHARINSIGGAGATVRLVRLLGLAAAKELVLSGAVLEAAAAQRIGLVSAVVPSAELVVAAIERARGFCIGSPSTVSNAKRSMMAAADLALADALAFSLRAQAEVRAAQPASVTEQFKERRRDHRDKPE
ncbi:MAG: enoyl-CoA hydratase/isomerase family protein [Alphaproteobacteria bacterium]|nr:enoyl-CoA hydratase/isomerase family protein [Alphaproteobacteria bacterium]